MTSERVARPEGVVLRSIVRGCAAFVVCAPFPALSSPVGSDMHPPVRSLP